MQHVRIEPALAREVTGVLYRLREDKEPVSKQAIAEKLHLTVPEVSAIFRGDYNLQWMFKEIKSH